MDKTSEKERMGEIIEAVMKVARGDYSVQVEFSGENDEFDSLAMGLNMMIDDIRTSMEHLDGQRKKLSAVNKHLQQHIAERKKAQERISRAAEEWRMTFDAIADLVFIQDKDLRFTRVNKACVDTLKVKPENLIGKTCHEVLHKRDEPWPDCPMVKAFKDGKTHTAEIEDPNMGATLLVTASPIFDEKGEIVAGVHIAKDITDRKKAEETLQESEAKWRSITENSPDIVMLVGADGSILFINRTIGGLTRKEVIGTCVYDYIPDKYKSRVKECHERVLKTGNPDQYETDYQTIEGEMLHFEARVGPVRQSGKIVGITISTRDISQRKKMEKALEKKSYTLKESEEKWRSLTENTDDTIVITDKDDVIQYINKTIPPTTPEEVRGKTIYEYVSKEHHQVMRESLKKVYQTGKPHGYEVALDMQRIDPKIGTLWYSTKAVPIKQDRKTVGVIMVSTNITQQKKMEEALEKKSYTLKERVEELDCLYGVSRLVEKENISLEEILEGTLNLIPPSWRYSEITCARIILEGQEFKTNNFRETAWRQSSDIAVHGKKIGTVEVFYLEEKPMSDEGPFLKEERSLIDAIAKQLARIIERKRIENELRIKEEAIASSLNAITLADLKGNLTYVNRSFLHMWGYSNDKEALGKPIARFLDTQDKATELTEALRNKKSWMGELAAKRKDGSTFDVQLLASIVENEAGRAICMMASVIDITERKRIEQMKDDFVSLASHELRTPLTSIVGYVDLILGEDVGKINKEQKEFLQIISQNTQRLESLINDVLDIEKIESGRIKLKREKVNLIELIEASVNTFKVMAENKNLELEKEIKTPELEVLGDSDRLSQVLSNLLSNAIKYTKEGRVKVTAQAKGRFASVTVEDSGLGMRQEDLRNIFSRFFRSEDSYVKKTTGSGLGLSIAKATIERHNGDMKVESKLGVGSRFEVILPLLKKTEKV